MGLELEMGEARLCSNDSTSSSDYVSGSILDEKDDFEAQISLMVTNGIMWAEVELGQLGRKDSSIVSRGAAPIHVSDDESVRSFSEKDFELENRLKDGNESRSTETSSLAERSKLPTGVTDCSGEEEPRELQLTDGAQFDGKDVRQEKIGNDCAIPQSRRHVEQQTSADFGRLTIAVSPAHNNLDIANGHGTIALGDNEDDCSSSEEEEDEAEMWNFPSTSTEKGEVEELNYGVDERDLNTSDDWIVRHPSLVRLTGRHPFNSEPPLSSLMQHGFLTPTSIHYVRNHGYVPRAVWEEWTIEVCGLVKRPLKLKMKDLIERYPGRELPVTLVCAGNRRKEQNMVKKSIGFNWGAAAVSTSVWRGARLCDILRHCRVVSRKKGARFVCFEGAEMLPGGGGSRYGTSIPLANALDESQDVLLAYQQNGELLKPDHGFPVRMIIPGYIGGRMVKWVTRIEVTSQESNNHYHYHDNRVLPTHVNEEKANSEGWWYRPEYIINELNINSVITSPANLEELSFSPASTSDSYLVKGYAYSGGGRKVIRVEISFDGETWRLCEVQHHEKPTKYGKYWCWCFWQLKVELSDFVQSKELMVRAWDAAMNSQPERLTWNVMGMMNNCWFRVKINVCNVKERRIGLRFEHPTSPGNEAGGWMVRDREEPLKVVEAREPNTDSSFITRETCQQISMSEVRRHSKAESPWIVVHNSVYDCTDFLKDHPGGADSILLCAGTDATEEFDAIHSRKAKVLLEKYKIGELTNDIAATLTTMTNENENENSDDADRSLESCELVALNPKKKLAFTLIEKTALSKNIRKFRFSLQSEKHVLGLPVGKHVLLSATINGKLVMRSYTPTSCDDDAGYFELLVKIYRQDEKNPVGGLMSQYLETLQSGDSVQVRGPLGHMHYLGRGHFAVNGCLKFATSIGMIAGGTGITPLYQVIRAILKDPEDTTDVSLLYCNRLSEDIMLKQQLDDWQEQHRNFKVRYTISGPVPHGWKHGVGRPDQEMLRHHLPSNPESSVAFVCGPSALEKTCLCCLEKLGYDRTLSCFLF